MSAPEAMWRLSEYHMHEQSHTITSLAVHLPDLQRLYFRAGEEAEAAWRLSEYHMYEQSHTITRPAVHLPDQQRVYFRAGEEAKAVEREASRKVLKVYLGLSKVEGCPHIRYTLRPLNHHTFGQCQNFVANDTNVIAQELVQGTP